MSNVLGSILVNLLANTASFEQGMNAAQKQAQKTGKEIQRTFEDIGGTAEKLLAPLGNIGSNFASALSEVGSASRSLLTNLGPLGGAFGEVGLAIAGVAAVAAAAGAATLGFAVEASEAAAHLYDLHQSTGLTVESLSALGQIAKISNIGVDQLASGLEKMNKSAVAAAAAGPKTTSIYKELGVQVTDTSGKLRSAEAIFQDLANRFAAMPNSVEKTNAAIKVFGRAGAELIPILNRGGSGIADLITHLEKMGAVLDTRTAASAEKLQENIVLLEASLTGLKNQLLAQLLPALNSVAEEFVRFVETNHQVVSDFASGLAGVGKGLLTLFEAASAGIDLVVTNFKTQAKVVLDIARGIELAARNAKRGALDLAVHDIEVGLKNAEYDAEKAADHITDVFKKKYNAIQDLYNAQLPPPAPEPNGPPPPTKQPVDTDFIKKAVEDAQLAAQKEIDLADAIGKIGSALREATAAAEAHERVQRLLYEAQKKNVAISPEVIRAIRQAAETEQRFKGILEDSKAFDDFDKAIDRQIETLKEQRTNEGAVGQEQAKNLAGLAILGKRLDDARDIYKQLAAARAADTEEVRKAADAVAKLTDQYDREAQKVQEANAQLHSNAFETEFRSIGTELSNLQRMNQALLEGGQAFAEIEDQVQKLTDRLKPNEEELEKLRQRFEAIREERVKQAALQVAASNDLNKNQELKDLETQLQTLKEVRTEWQGSGKDTTYIDSAINELSNRYDQLAEQILLKTNSYKNGIKAAWTEITKQIETNSQFAFDVVTKGIQGFESTLTEALVTGKANWRGFFESLEAEILKFALNKTISTILQDLSGTGLGKAIGGVFASSGGTGGIGGIVGAASGQAGKTASTAQLTAAAATLQAAGTALSSAAATLAPTGASLEAAAAALQAAASALSSSAFSGGGGGGFLDFGGFAADGGDVTPGMAYIVGEEGPELFSPSVAGNIIPNSSLGSARSNVTIHVDARGADAGVEQRVMRTMRLFEDRAVLRAVTTVSEINKRTPTL